MSKASNPGLFQRLLSRPAPMLQDAADLGTAFGLDLSIDQMTATPALAEPVARTAPGWMQRLTLRARATP